MSHSVLARVIQTVLLCTLLMMVGSGCGDSPSTPPLTNPPIITEADKLISSLSDQANRLSKLKSASSVKELADGLRKSSEEINQWSNEYFMLRAKMQAKGSSAAQEEQIADHYRKIKAQVSTTFDETATALQARSDYSSFETELKQTRASIEKLP